MAKITILAFAMLAICRGADSATVTGQVTSTTGQPLKNATVRMYQVVTLTAPPAPGQAPPPVNVLNTTTDASGNFAFESLDAGRYTITAQRSGYLRQDLAETVMIGVGKPASVSIKLTPESRIEGRVTNQDGDPLTGARVSVSHWTAVGPNLQLIPISSGATTAEDGSFVIGNLPAGHYFVSATVEPRPQDRNREAKTPHEIDLATYFPGVAALSSATMLNVIGGAVMQGIDIRLLRGVVYSVQGRAVDTASGSPVPNAAITLSADGPERRAAASATTKEDGTFQLTVGPGDYAVQARPRPASGAGPQRNPQFGAARFTDQRITVGKENIEDLELRLSPGAEIDVKFTTEDIGRPRTILLYPSGPNQAGQNQIQASPGGSVLIHDVGPGDYTAHLAGLPAGTYVKSVRYGQQDVTGKTFNVSSAGGTLEILLSPHAADVTGVLRNSTGDPIPDVQVSLWKSGQPAEGYAVTGPGGSFQFVNLAPGEYRAVAWGGPGMLPVPQFLSQFESQAATVKLDQDSHQTIDVPLIKPDAIDAALENVR